MHDVTSFNLLYALDCSIRIVTLSLMTILNVCVLTEQRLTFRPSKNERNLASLALLCCALC
ncbi:hypothetical protein BDU57DRAFT_522571 [Ampelomyces quisqualis]|uniref:Uncharacterized protein n=1 Tax=Ampelomyces quisqualis TaxID=50730 RepID=A0A6A5Q9N7_AMPQU|nr:hypothetical protein BDU57DRAFT_522571 [Ampelomyces quisqualis]